jgi:hypothetical protein
MSPRSLAFSSLTLGSVAALAALGASYGLVYPARAHHSKVPLALALAVGSLAACLAGWLSLTAHRRARQESERFLALLSLVLSGFFLFVIVIGFGIPDLILEARD